MTTRRWQECPQCVDELAVFVAQDPAAGARLVCASPAVPFGAARPLAICQACLGLVPQQGRHSCPLRDAGLVATAVGWATPTSSALGALVRVGDGTAVQLTAILLADAFRRRSLGSAALPSGSRRIVVPVPTTTGREKQALMPLARAVAESLGAEPEGLLTRQKYRSTKGSLSQERSRIAAEEYAVVNDASHNLAGAEVVLLDDRITTGHTAAGIARVLADAGAKCVRVLVLDRTVSTRVLQRLNVPLISCAHPVEMATSLR